MIIHILYYGYRIYQFFVRPVTLGVRVMLVQGSRVLLIRHTYLRGWYMPGGGLKRGETMEAAARREAMEEAGAALGELQLIGVYTHLEDTKSDHNIVFLCTDFEWNDRHDREVAEVKFFPMDRLPADTRPGHRRRIEAYAQGRDEKNFGLW